MITIFLMLLSMYYQKHSTTDVSLDDLREVLQNNIKQLAKNNDDKETNNSGNTKEVTIQEKVPLNDEKKDLIKSFFTNMKQEKEDDNQGTKDEIVEDDDEDVNIIDVPSDDQSEDEGQAIEDEEQTIQDTQTVAQTEQALQGLDTSISEDPAESIENDTLTQQDVDSFKVHTKQMHEVTSDIHENMISLQDSKDLQTDQEALKRYNELRNKLAKVSEIYKKKYPQCLPIPISVLDNKSEKVEDKKTQECRYAYYLGYNYTLQR